ncbi:MAG: beta-N-acetylhexosaminidase [Candidatus Eisenbacteria bacterium]|nr:beta-N-acetylhexosaminidase [Candidatus Eisenbacteria bacterium]
MIPLPQRVVLTGESCEFAPSRVTSRIVSDGIGLGDEGYRLRAGSSGILIEALTEAGLSYGHRTLQQVLAARSDRPDLAGPVAASGGGRPLVLQGLLIEDRPRFSWRGLHLDVARHFFPAARVCEAIEWCAEHKLNRLHWHLTDDQGWRLPVPGRPRLAEISSRRKEADGSTHAGLYTAEEIREVIRHAATRNVTVVPEIDLPGHVRAALAAYPELSCSGEVLPVPATWGIFEDVLCAGSDDALDFVTEVLSAVASLFPGKYIHIGGDEVLKNRWAACPKCRARMEREGLETPEDLQSWFVRRVARMVGDLGRTPVGWDEILEGGAPPGAVVMSWRGIEGGIAAARGGHHVVMCPTGHCYLDSYQGPRDAAPPAFPRDVDLEAAYAFEPAPSSIENPDLVLGGQACVWTERIPDWEHLGTMTFPRLCAIAEALWTDPRRRDYPDFLLRMRLHERRLLRAGIKPYPLPAS